MIITMKNFMGVMIMKIILTPALPKGGANLILWTSVQTRLTYPVRELISSSKLCNSLMRSSNVGGPTKNI